jgi:hypothetical protein
MLLIGSTAFAQGSPPQATNAAPETADAARGWALLAQGEPAKASSIAAKLLIRYPRSVVALALAVDAEIARGGAAAGLAAYERWMQNRTLEDGYVLRRVARALLTETVRSKDRSAAAWAREALIADGETGVAGEPGTTGTGGGAEAKPQSRQNEAAVTKLIDGLADPMVNKRPAIAALVNSKSQRAVKPLIGLLGDPDPTVRGAAADGLGELGATSAIPDLKPLLNDPVFSVHLSAAAALFALKDMSGLPFLRELQASEHGAIRLEAARALRSDPDAGWLDQLRSLTKDPDPEVRRQAAELIAPHDPETARATLEPLLKDDNPAEREAASKSYLQHAVTDFGALRQFLQSPDSATRVQAAARILELTR